MDLGGVTVAGNIAREPDPEARGCVETGGGRIEALLAWGEARCLECTDFFARCEMRFLTSCADVFGRRDVRFLPCNPSNNAGIRASGTHTRMLPVRSTGNVSLIALTKLEVDPVIRG